MSRAPTAPCVCLALALCGCRSPAASMEANLNLHNIARGAVAYYLSEHTGPLTLAPGASLAIVQDFPPSTTLTPAKCCTPRCPAEDPGWNQRGWMGLRFAPTQPTQYRYQFTSS